MAANSSLFRKPSNPGDRFIMITFLPASKARVLDFGSDLVANHLARQWGPCCGSLMREMVAQDPGTILPALVGEFEQLQVLKMLALMSSSAIMSLSM